MAPHIDLKFLHMVFQVFFCLYLKSELLCQMAPALYFIEIGFPFFQEDSVKIFFLFQHADLNHDSGVEKIVLKRIVFEDQHIFRGDSREMVHILQIPGLIVAAELCSQLCPVFAVSVAYHEELVTEIDLVHIFQVGICLDVGAAIGGDDGDSGQSAVRGGRLRVIFPEKQGESAFILFAFHNEDKADIHKVAGIETQIIQYPVHISPLP